MSQEVLNVEQLLSQARNPTHGQTDKGLVPTRVFNLVPDRMGGYTAFGHRSALRDSEGDHISLDPDDELLGLDETGIASFYVEDPLILV